MNDNQKKIKIAILFLVIFILTFSYLIKTEFRRYHVDDDLIFENYPEPKLKGAGFWDLTGSPIYINNNDPARNWAITAATNEWCSGSGTWNDPYIIENVTIDGQGAGQPVKILNSEVYFIVRNNTLFNGHTGVWLETVENGFLINNSVSYCSSTGIQILFGDNNSISENLVKYNVRGIRVPYGSDDNTIRNNSVSFNGDSSSILHAGIIIESGSDGNIVQENEVFSNVNGGIIIEGNSNNNEILGNNLYNNDYGMHLRGSGYNQILENNITINDYGLYIEYNSNINNVSKNYVANNVLYGILIQNSQSNLIYFNNFSLNNINAYDDGSENNWDYGRVGNYWDDYSGIDSDNNSIGDTPFDIPGSALSKDYYPVVGSFESVVFYFPFDDSDDTLPVSIAIISIIIAFGIIGSLGVLYGNHKYSWFKSLKRKRQIKLKEKELKVEKFQDLLIKSKDLNEKANFYYSKGSFSNAINAWRGVIRNYNLSLKKVPSKHEGEKIRDALKIVHSNICKVNIKIGEQYLITANELHQKGKFSQAEVEWKSAKNNFLTAIDVIKSEKLAIEYKKLNDALNNIEVKLKRINIEKLIIEADATLKNAKLLQEKDLSGAIKTVVDSISHYFKVNKIAEEYGGFEEIIKKIQVKIKEASNFQSELQEKIIKLIEIAPIAEESKTEGLIEVKNYECPFCGELITKGLIQEHTTNQSIECKYCGVNIPKKELR